MACEWIKWTKGLTNKREVRLMAVQLDRSREEIAARLMLLWEWLDDQIDDSCIDSDGNARVTLDRYACNHIDDLSGIAGFAAAMISADWLRLRGPDNDIIEVPNYARHNGDTAKERAKTAKRVAKFRKRRRNESVTAAPLPEKRRGEKKKTPASAGVPPDDPAEASPRPRNPVWDAVCAVFGLEPKAPSHRTRIGKIVRELNALGATPDDIRIRTERYRKHWPDIDCTPEALVKHWGLFAIEPDHGKRGGAGASAKPATGPGAHRPGGLGGGYAAQYNRDLPR